MADTRKFAEIEMAHAALGKTPSPDSIEIRAYLARVAESDAKAAEAYALAHPDLDPLQRARSFLRRGTLAEANDILNKLQAQALDGHELAEVCLEQARLANARAQWSLAVEFATRGLAAQPTGITQLTLRQVQAVAHFELGEWTQARRELALASSLAKIFPASGVALYLSATEIKCQLAQGELDKASAGLARAWETLRTGPDLNVDNVLLFGRCEVELRRQRGENFSDWAIGTWLLARAAGDELYAGLALLDIWSALEEESFAHWRSELKIATERFERVRLMADQVQTGQARSSSAIMILQGTRKERRHQNPALAESTSHLVLKSVKIFVKLQTLQVTTMDMTPQQSAVWTALASGPVAKADFFRQIWGTAKFVPHLHDSVIRSLLHRLRKTHALPVVSQQSQIHIPGLWICA